MSTVNEDLLANEEPREVVQEAEKLFKLAEVFYLNYLNQEQRINSFNLMVVWFFGLMLILTGFGWLLIPDTAKLPIAVVSLGIVIGFSAYWYSTWKWIKQLVLREKKALLEIVDLLREVEKAIAEHGHLSALERAAFRIRLSLFDIGPSGAKTR